MLCLGLTTCHDNNFALMDFGGYPMVDNNNIMVIKEI